MLDFLIIKERRRSINIDGHRETIVEIYPDWDTIDHSDVMCRGGDFYAAYVSDDGFWTTSEDIVKAKIDEAMVEYKKQHYTDDDNVRIMYMRYASTGSIDGWHKYCQKQMRESWTPLDRKIIYSNQEVNRDDFCSKRLDYPLIEGSTFAWEKMIGTHFDEENKRKIEWIIGAIVSGASRNIQKFGVIYGPPRSGKSTLLNIIESLFKGYLSYFDAKEVTSGKEFALEPFRDSPLISIQHDGDLSRITDNTILNSLVSHETVIMNIKNKSRFPMRFETFILIATNKPVKITEAKSGLIRRLIDITPSGKELPPKEYDELKNQIEFEKGAIAYHCLKVFESLGANYYDHYIPQQMISDTNDFYDFVDYYYEDFKTINKVTSTEAYDLYLKYCKYSNVLKPLPLREFRVELKNYFENYDEQTWISGKHYRKLYSNFKTYKFGYEVNLANKAESDDNNQYDGWLKFDKDESLFDIVAKDCPAQYAKADKTPKTFWSNVKTKLKDIRSTRLHYVNLPENHIVLDFDLRGDNGEKDLAKNIEAANKFPRTYAELSQSGGGIHLHYIYDGDISRLCANYDEHIEIKTFSGNGALRRKLSKCNDIPIATLSSGLPLKGEKKVTDSHEIKSESILRYRIFRAMNKEYSPGYTTPMVSLIKKMLDDVYNMKPQIPYDVSDLESVIRKFASDSSHQSQYCLKLVDEMHFKSDHNFEESIPEQIASGKTLPNDIPGDGSQLVFFDTEVFINLFVLVWKFRGNCDPVVLINPTAKQMEEFYRICLFLIGFNCKKYDNHVMRAKRLGYSNEWTYGVSQNLINGDKSKGFSTAINDSWTDILDYSSKKQSLKKWEIELAREWSRDHPGEVDNPYRHQELGLPWDKPVPEELWPLVVEYCKNDVLMTEAVWEKTQPDFRARQILAKMAKGTVNDSTNNLTKRLIFGNDKNPQSKFRYRNLAYPVLEPDDELRRWLGLGDEPEFVAWNGEKSFMPFFPGYEFVLEKDPETGKFKRYSHYRGFVIGEGGYAWSEAGYYLNVWTFDVESEHPSSIENEMLFGYEYTGRFKILKTIRIHVKHGEYDKAIELMPELVNLLVDEGIADDLSTALKIAINAVYGLTAAKFPNAFKDPRNEDNIVAKRGELFMIDLLLACKERGYHAVHIKTDSIKIVNPSEECKEFIFEFGRRYGYKFAIEHIYERFCIINKADYIAKCAQNDPKSPGKWSATGKRFKVPYVFKCLFTDDDITIDDVCETFSVSKSALYLDMNEGLQEGEHDYRFVGRVGEFIPILEGRGGGELLRSDDGVRYLYPGGAKDYRWLEAPDVIRFHKEDCVNYGYFDTKVEDAKKEIGKYVSYDALVSGEPFAKGIPDDFINVPEDAPEEGLPFN